MKDIAINNISMLARMKIFIYISDCIYVHLYPINSCVTVIGLNIRTSQKTILVMVSDEVKAHINFPSSVVASRVLNDLHN